MEVYTFTLRECSKPPCSSSVAFGSINAQLLFQNYPEDKTIYPLLPHEDSLMPKQLFFAESMHRLTAANLLSRAEWAVALLSHGCIEGAQHIELEDLCLQQQLSVLYEFWATQTEGASLPLWKRLRDWRGGGIDQDILVEDLKPPQGRSVVPQTTIYYLRLSVGDAVVDTRQGQRCVHWEGLDWAWVSPGKELDRRVFVSAWTEFGWSGSTIMMLDINLHDGS
ncbi:hypothetical protein K488DRAFT_73620 [Vararia minispora EC-137]|uniref:Uncharacterized protein n=1 Tax=Vararia minispora EC-137 TaxID=1314806 RepID=A0ACB8QAF6_9AGAM|nr:hypothetical protein K488DRAFT_73620 [Vararia minispora EC-137]